MDAEGSQRMARVVRHRLRNIASGIRGAVQLLDEETVGVLAPELREYFPLILKECDGLCEIAARWSLFYDTSTPVGESEPVEAMTVHVLDSLMSEFPGVEIRIKGTADGYVSGTMGHCLRELVVNACEAASRGTVDVEIEPSPDGVQWVISDSGPGVNCGLREHVFLPFYTTRPRHLGLGLPLAQRLAQAAGGRCALRDGKAGRNEWVMELFGPWMAPQLS